jgi:hypothetical protein
VATEKLHVELANVGENLLFPEICIEGLSQKHLIFAYNIKRLLIWLYTQFLGKIYI